MKRGACLGVVGTPSRFEPAISCVKGVRRRRWMPLGPRNLPEIDGSPRSLTGPVSAIAPPEAFHRASIARYLTSAWQHMAR